MYQVSFIIYHTNFSINSWVKTLQLYIKHLTLRIKRCKTYILKVGLIYKATRLLIKKQAKITDHLIIDQLKA